MNRKVTDDQQLVSDELKRALADVDAPTPSSDTLIDLLAFTAQARRLVTHLGPASWPALEGEALRGEVWLSTHLKETKAALDELVPTDALDQLESALCEVPADEADDDWPQAAPILDALFDVDRMLSALEQGGRATRALRDEVLDLVGCFEEGARICAEQARRFVARHGEVGGGASVYARVASATRVVQLEAPLASGAPPTWLAQAIEDHAEPGVIRFPTWLVSRASAGRLSATNLTVAAAHEHAPIPESVPVWVAGDGAWELMFEPTPTGDVALVMYGRDGLPNWEVLGVDGRPLTPTLDLNRASVVLGADLFAGPWTVRVDGIERRVTASGVDA